jgi:hypothetical protein
VLFLLIIRPMGFKKLKIFSEQKKQHLVLFVIF